MRTRHWTYTLTFDALTEDHVHPVGMRSDVYGARTHRRQMSNSSVVSTGSVQSGYAMASGVARGSTS